MTVNSTPQKSTNVVSMSGNTAQPLGLQVKMLPVNSATQNQQMDINKQ